MLGVKRKNIKNKKKVKSVVKRKNLIKFRENEDNKDEINSEENEEKNENKKVKLKNQKSKSKNSKRYPNKIIKNVDKNINLSEFIVTNNN